MHDGSDKLFNYTERSSQGKVKKNISYVKIKIIISFTEVFLLTKSATVPDFCLIFPSQHGLISVPLNHKRLSRANVIGKMAKFFLYE